VLVIIKISERLSKKLFMINLVIVILKTLLPRFLIGTGEKINIRIFEITSVFIIGVKSERLKELKKLCTG